MKPEVAEMMELAERCALCRCGCCKDQCPMYSEILEETISPKGRNLVIRGLAKGVIEVDPRVVRIAYSCLLCRRDELNCTAKLKNADATEAFRAYLIDKGVPLLPEHEVLVKSLENYGNPWQESKAARKRWAKELKSKKAVPGKTDMLFFVGCTFALDRTLQEGPRAFASIMDKAGVSYGLLLEDELCCGSTAKRIGHTKLFEKLRAENEKRLRETGAKTIVTGCSGCYKTLRQDYPDLARDVKIVHSSEVLESLVSSGKLRFEGKPVKVTYHDPCHLGRHTEVYEPPRAALKAVPGVRLIEMTNSRELSRCCGGGAGVKTAYPEVSRKVAARRTKEAEETGAEALVTTCPFCVQTLRAAAEASGSRIRVLELSAFIDGLAMPKGGA